MGKSRSPAGFLSSRSTAVLSGILLLQTAIYYRVANRAEHLPPSRPLSELPAAMGGWQLAVEGVVEKEIQDVLKADDLLSRYYNSPAGASAASLFVAYFRSQRAGKSPHSPKNCLPGAGWTQLRSGTVTVPVADADPIVVNRYVVAKGASKSMVFYWYQSARRVEASEYWAKVFLVLDAIRYNRSDTALVRVVVPIVGDDQQLAEKAGMDFVRAVFPQVSRHFSI